MQSRLKSNLKESSLRCKLIFNIIHLDAVELVCNAVHLGLFIMQCRWLLWVSSGCNEQVVLLVWIYLHVEKYTLLILLLDIIEFVC